MNNPFSSKVKGELTNIVKMLTWLTTNVRISATCDMAIDFRPIAQMKVSITSFNDKCKLLIVNAFGYTELKEVTKF